jgi:glutathione synthase/RimK-type ligase-like ATP-grasp enzyme
VNRRIPNGMYGGVRGRELITPSYSIGNVGVSTRQINGASYHSSRLLCGREDHTLMSKYPSSTVTSKWTKTKWLIADDKLKKFVPKTKLFSRSSLESLTDRYKTVYFKPTNGTGGKDIARIQRKNSLFTVQIDSKKMKCNSTKDLYTKLKTMAKGSSYLLQQGIDLMTSNGHPFDLRVMIQKPKDKGWVPSAVFTKVGKKNKVVTNYHQGGKLAFLEETLKAAGYSARGITKAKEKLNHMGVSTGRCFSRHRKGFRELGLDVAIDSKGRYWILEVNTRPQFYPLKYMNDKRMYHRIVKYGKEYGRF